MHPSDAHNSRNELVGYGICILPVSSRVLHTETTAQMGFSKLAYHLLLATQLSLAQAVQHAVAGELLCTGTHLLGCQPHPA